jgi:hypothetical protein
MEFIDMTPEEKRGLAQRFPQCNETGLRFAPTGMCFVRKATLTLRTGSPADSSKYRNIFVYVDFPGHPRGPGGEDYNLALFDIVGFDF